MSSFIQFLFGALFILSALAVFVVLLVGGWIVGTLYLWLDGTSDEGQPKLTWWNRSNK